MEEIISNIITWWINGEDPTIRAIHAAVIIVGVISFAVITSFTKIRKKFY